MRKRTVNRKMTFCLSCFFHIFPYAFRVSEIDCEHSCIEQVILVKVAQFGSERSIFAGKMCTILRIFPVMRTTLRNLRVQIAVFPINIIPQKLCSYAGSAFCLYLRGEVLLDVKKRPPFRERPWLKICFTILFYFCCLCQENPDPFST